MPKSEVYRRHRCEEARINNQNADAMVHGYEQSLRKVNENREQGSYREFLHAMLDHWKECNKLACRQVEKWCGQLHEATQEGVQANPDYQATPGENRERHPHGAKRWTVA